MTGKLFGRCLVQGSATAMKNKTLLLWGVWVSGLGCAMLGCDQERDHLTARDSTEAALTARYSLPQRAPYMYQPAYQQPATVASRKPDSVPKSPEQKAPAQSKSNEIVQTSTPKEKEAATAKPSTAADPTAATDPAAGEARAAEAKAGDSVLIDEAIQIVDKQAIGNESSFHNRGSLPRRSYVDLTAQPWFSHSGDYGSLSGQVRYSQSDHSWRLRYASLDDNDAYGGTVTLLANPQLDGLKDGQHVRVQGALVNPDRKEPGCDYKVTSVQIMENK
jgi:hypothetical protein